MNRTTALAVAGVVAFALGLATLAVPGLFALGAERVVVIAVGLLALGQLLRVVQARRHGPIRRAGTGDPELPMSVERPGESLEAILDAFDPDRYRYRGGNRRKRQLEAVVVEALQRYRNLTPADARDRISDGTWTDDPVAAAFLGGDEAGDISLGSRLRSRLTGESLYQRGVRHTIAAICGVAGLPAEPATGDGNGARPGVRRLQARFSDHVDTGDPPSEWPDRRDSKRRLTGHWRGISAVTLSAIGVGVLAEEATVLLVGVVGISYAAYARSAASPAPELAIERSVSLERPARDETVEVTVTVTNDGDRLLPDLRVVDGVPAALSVVDGSPRHGTSLRAGETATFSYTVDARRGAHEFDPVHVVARTVSGSVEYELTESATEPTTITCVPPLEEVETTVPVRTQPTGLTGRVETSLGGTGSEFFATRTYRPGDPMTRIDWNRRAKTGELATLEFREERSVTAVLLVDATDSAAVGPDARGSDAIDRSVDAARQVSTTLLDEGNRVGIAGLAAGNCWIPPGTGECHRTAIRECLATEPAFAAGGGSQSYSYRRVSRLRSRMPSDAQVILFSPLCSDILALVASRLDAYGYPVTVVSPDPTTHRSPGSQAAALARRFRISDLREAGVPVIDWPWGDPLAVALARSTGRWSR